MNLRKATFTMMMKKYTQLLHDKSKSYRIPHIINQIRKRLKEEARGQE